MRSTEGEASPPSPQLNPTAAFAGARRDVCYTLTRGIGELILDEQGSLHFLASPKPAWYPFWPKALRRLSQAERSLTIVRDQLRVAVPFYDFYFGPSVVVGYRTPDNGMGWEEFMLARLPPSGGLPIPTGDAQIWARALVPKEASQEQQDEAVRHRRQIHRPLFLAYWKFVMVLGTALLGLVYGIIMVLLWRDGTGVLFALATFVVSWLFWALLTFLICLWSNR